MDARGVHKLDLPLQRWRFNRHGGRHRVRDGSRRKTQRLTVDTVWLRRIYLLAFISIGSRRVEYFALTVKPDTAWMLQQARNLLMELDDHDRRVRFLIHDRDAKFPRAFDALLASGRIKVSGRPSGRRTRTRT